MNSTEFLDFVNQNMRNINNIEDELYYRYNKCSFRKRQEFSVIDKDSDGSLYERIFSCIDYKRDGFKFQEIMAISEKHLPLSRNCFYTYYGFQNGLHVYGFRGENYRGSSSGYGYIDPVEYCDFMEESDIEAKKVYSIDMFTIDDIITLDSSLKYCAYHENFDIRAAEYIRLYRLYPIAEMLMKLNLTQMITEKALAIITGNRQLQKWIYHNSTELKRIAFATAYNAYKKKANPKKYAKAISERAKIGRTLSFSDKTLYKKLLRYTTREAVYKYITTKKNVNSASYCDYLKAADWLKLDFSNTKVLFPRCFKKVHDDYTKQYSAHLNEALNEKMAAVADMYSFLEWTDGTYRTICARTKQELIDEGSALDHCVGCMGYDKKQAEGKSVIVFLRQCSNTTNPYVTVEVKITGRPDVQQCYGLKDRKVPEVDDFVKRWMKHTCAAYNKSKKKVA
jgi:hypothetical protein